jgi:hypothetical protein
VIRTDVPLVRAARGTTVHHPDCGLARRIKVPVPVELAENGHLPEVRFARDDPRWPHHLYFCDACWWKTHTDE